MSYTLVICQLYGKFFVTQIIRTDSKPSQNHVFHLSCEDLESFWSQFGFTLVSIWFWLCFGLGYDPGPFSSGNKIVISPAGPTGG